MLFNMSFKRECKQIEALLWNYAGERLTESERAQVETHLERCSACQAQLQAYGHVQRGMDALRSQPVPTSAANWQDVRARLIAAQTEANGVQRPVGAWGRGIGWGAAATGAMGLLLWLKMAGPAAEPEPLFAEVDSSKPSKVAVVLPPESGETIPAVLPFATFASLQRNAETEALQTNSLMPSPLAAAFGIRSEWPGNTLAANLVGIRQAGATTPSHHNHAIHWRRAPRAWRPHQRPSLNETRLAGAPPREIITSVAFGNPLPEYVLTAVQTNEAQHRDFVMDSVDADAAGSESEHAGEAGEETRAW